MHEARTAWPVTTRVSHVVAYEHLRKQHPTLSARAFCAAIEVPYATFTRWWRRFSEQGARGLADRSRKPKHSPRALAGAVLDVIRTAQHELGVGCKRLHAILQADERIQCSASSVYRVLKRAGALTTKARPPKPVWQRYAKATPGERAQLDLKYLPENRFQCTLIDDCSRTLAATVLTGRTMADVVAARPILLERMPAPIQCLQTDNGSEFQSDFTAALAARGIRHAHTKPRTPRLNGKVERVQRTCAEEFWDGVTGTDLTTWEADLQTYVAFYNTARLHSALGYTTPAAFARTRLADPPAAHLS